MARLPQDTVRRVSCRDLFSRTFPHEVFQQSQGLSASIPPGTRREIHAGAKELSELLGRMT